MAPVGLLFAAFLGYNPIQKLLGPETLSHLTHAQAHTLTGRSFFPNLISGPFIDAMAIDPAKLAAAYKGPVLIVQGARDIQVSVADAQALRQAHPAAKLVLLPDANHVLKAVADDTRSANVATYADPSLPLAPGVVDAIAGFVTAR